MLLLVIPPYYLLLVRLQDSFFSAILQDDFLGCLQQDSFFFSGGCSTKQEERSTSVHKALLFAISKLYYFLGFRLLVSGLNLPLLRSPFVAKGGFGFGTNHLDFRLLHYPPKKSRFGVVGVALEYP